MRFVPSHWSLWRDLSRKRFPGKLPPVDGHWKRAYHLHLAQEQRVVAYQRDMMLGLLGRRQGPPVELAEPLVDAFALDVAGGSRPLQMMATRRLRARIRDDEAVAAAAVAASAAVAAASATAGADGATSARSGAGGAGADGARRMLPAASVSVVRRGDGDLNEDIAQDKRQLRIRQGSAPWSALG
jgi:hypothetical protein